MKKLNLSNRNSLLKVNTVASLTYQLVTLVCGFILPRLIIGYYGSSVYGLISSLTQFLGVIALLELGMGAVVPASLYKPLAEKDSNGISKIVVSSERFYRKIGLVMIFYVIGLTVFYPMIVDEFPFLYTASLLVIIASSTFAQYFFGITYSLLLTADQRQYITYIVNGSTIIINLILSFLLIKLGCSIHIVKLVSSLIFITRPVIFATYVKRHYNINKHITFEVEPIKQKWNGIAQHLAFAVQEKIGVVILSLMSTLESVSIYSVYYLIVSGLRGLIYSITSSLTSFLGNILAKDEKDTLLRDFYRIEWSMHTITVLLFSSAAVLIVPFVRVYTAGITDANYIVPVFPYLMCAAVACRCLQLPYNIVVQAAGHFKETQGSAILEPVIDIIITIALIGKMGLNGVALGMLVAMIYRMLYLSIYLTHYILQTSKHQLLKRFFTDLVLTASIVGFCSMIPTASTTYLSWGVVAVEVFLVAIVATLIVNFIFYRSLTVSFVKTILRKARVN